MKEFYGNYMELGIEEIPDKQPPEICALCGDEIFGESFEFGSDNEIFCEYCYLHKL